VALSFGINIHRVLDIKPRLLLVLLVSTVWLVHWQPARQPI